MDHRDVVPGSGDAAVVAAGLERPDRVLGHAEHLGQRNARIDEHAVERELDRRSRREIVVAELPRLVKRRR